MAVVGINDRKERESNQDHLNKLTAESRRVFAWIEILRDIEAYKSVKVLDGAELHTNIAGLQSRSCELVRHITQLEGMI